MTADRWECDCSDPPVLLGLVDPDGTLHIRVRDCFYTITNPGRVLATCHRCGQQRMYQPVTSDLPPAA